MDKKCPDGMILNPQTGRCVKIDGKIGRKLTKKCPEGKILNDQTGRCVKINGKIGKKISKIVSIIFEPGLSILVNSSFDSGRSKSSVKRKNIWTQVNIQQYLKWYSTFSSKLSDLFLKNNMQFMGYSPHSSGSQEYLMLKFRALHAKEIQQALLKSKSTGLKETFTTVKHALNPDQYEEHVVVYDDVIHLVECIEIVGIDIK
jgi:hypothetical protein